MSSSLGRFIPFVGPLLCVVALSGCATLGQLRALEHVDFSIDRLSRIQLASVDVTRVQAFSDLSLTDAAALANAVRYRELPLSLEIQVLAENPADNLADARLLQLDWTLLLEDRETVSGRVDREIVLPRGEPTTFPVAVSLNLVEFFEGNARDLFNIAASLSGYGTESTDIELRALPVVQTAFGPISYPEPIRIVRTTVGR
jgi:hypothetical protein